MELLKHPVIDVDFNNIDPNYYFIKYNENEDHYRIPFTIDKNYFDRMDLKNSNIKIGEKGFKDPIYPEIPKEAFEQFKNHKGFSSLLIIIGAFLNNVYSWNTRAIEQELEEINNFINDANKINIQDAFSCYSHNLRANGYKRDYVRLENGYFNQNNIKNCVYCDFVYGKYFLFKELLEYKLNENKKPSTKKDKTDKKALPIFKNLFKVEKKADEFKMLLQTTHYTDDDNNWKHGNIMYDLAKIYYILIEINVLVKGAQNTQLKVFYKEFGIIEYKINTLYKAKDYLNNHDEIYNNIKPRIDKLFNIPTPN